MKGKVFVVQRPAYYSRERKGWVNKYDISAAEVYGELIFLLPPSNIYKDRLARAISTLHEILVDYGDDDHLLAIGDPVAIAAAVLVAASKNDGRVSLLKFDRLDGSYEPFAIDVSPNNG